MLSLHRFSNEASIGGRNVSGSQSLISAVINVRSFPFQKAPRARSHRIRGHEEQNDQKRHAPFLPRQARRLHGPEKHRLLRSIGPGRCRSYSRGVGAASASKRPWGTASTGTSISPVLPSWPGPPTGTDVPRPSGYSAWDRCSRLFSRVSLPPPHPFLRTSLPGPNLQRHES